MSTGGVPVMVRRQRPTLVLTAAVVALMIVIGQDPARVDAAITIAVFALLALSVAISYGQAGILSVAQAAFAALGAYASAILTTRWELSPVLGLVGAVLVPALVAYPLSRLVGRLSHLALAIATLVFGEIVVILLREGGDLTGGYIGISGIPPLPWALDLKNYAIFSWVAVIVVVALYANLVGSSHGRALQTIRWDTLRARADGVDVPARVAGVFSLSAAVAGLAGWLYAHYVTFLAPESLPSALSITAILMAVVGGTRYVLGPIVGTAVLFYVNDALPSEEAQGLLYGAALVVALIVAPQGLLGLADQARRAIGRRPAPRLSPPARSEAPESASPTTRSDEPAEVTR
ncbi:branched-chain amino acid ABC transporter permease [Nocardioides sp. L-11A]|uniref:branched-chain amino acid ABC transporter permease n=1 Tax=Nocardioides sp. L-11A TaxID=3043848 RepID=UPI00249A02E1|nr:branched-chain amino acid ABC transporter permease [Nocardioides sp. L-11A]